MDVLEKDLIKKFSKVIIILIIINSVVSSEEIDDDKTIKFDLKEKICSYIFLDFFNRYSVFLCFMQFLWFIYIFQRFFPHKQM